MNIHLAQNQDVKNKINQGTKKLEQKCFSCLYMNATTPGNKKEKLKLELLFYDLSSITEAWWEDLHEQNVKSTDTLIQARSSEQKRYFTWEKKYFCS